MFHILIAEDDATLCHLEQKVLEKNGYKVTCAKDGEEALLVLDKEFIDLIVCDVMMPKLDGYELMKELRESGFNQPILMVTAKDQFADKHKGFLLGADDYMVKPIDVNEMVLRVAALLRRAKIVSERKILCGRTTLEYDSLTLVNNEKGNLELPQKEFYLLFKLLSFPGKIFTRQQIMDEIWGMESETDLRTVDVHINRLREKLSKWDDFSIVTIRGLGYKAVKKTDENRQ